MGPADAVNRFYHTRYLDVGEQVYQIDRPLYQIPGGLPFAAGLDILRLFPQYGHQSLRHAVFECGKSVQYFKRISISTSSAAGDPRRRMRVLYTCRKSKY